MRKFFLFLVSAATLVAATSCSKEQFSEELPAGKQVMVTLTADLGDLGSRAEISDGTKINELAWAVYLKGSNKPLEDLHGTLPISEKKGTLELRLTTGRSYDIALFAYHTADATNQQVTAKVDNVAGVPNPSYYTVDWDNKTVSINDFETQLANDSDNRDCFWFVRQGLDVQGPVEETFILKRPLAQLNFGSSEADTEAARKAGVVVGYSQIVASSYGAFNLFDGKCVGERKEITFKQNAKPTQALTVVPDKTTGVKVNYNYLGTVYLLLNEELQSVKLTTYDTIGTGNTINQVEYSNVPLQRNWRTNIIGNILTNPAAFNIIVDEKFDNDYIKNHWDGSAEEIIPDATTGVYHVTTPAQLAWIAHQVNNGLNDFAGKEFVLEPSAEEYNIIDLNGTHWLPIGNAANPFRGNFDGKNAPIHNLNIDCDEYAGLFGNVVGNISNVNITNATIVSNHFAGAVVGYIYGDVKGCSVSGLEMTVTPNDVTRATAYDNGDKVGGIVGYVGEDGFTISNNTVDGAKITAYRDLGGIAGAAYVLECKGNVVKNATLTVDQTVNSYGTEDANLDELVGRILNDVKVLDTENTIEAVTLVYNPETLNPNLITPEITAVDKESLVFEGEAASQDVTVTVAGKSELKAVADADWVTVTVADAVVTVAVTENADAAARTATVTLTYGESSKSVAVSQAAVVPVVSVAKDAAVTAKAYGGSYTVNYALKGTAELKAEIDVDWATVTAADGVVTVKANYSLAAAARKGAVTLTYGDSTETIPVAQEEGKIYMKPNANWVVDNARFAVYTWNVSGDKWESLTAVEINNATYYEVAVSRVNTDVIFCRMNPSSPDNNWDNKWNQTSDLKLDGTNNLYSIAEGTWDNGQGAWSVLQAE